MMSVRPSVCPSEPSCSQNGESYEFAVFGKVVGFGVLFDDVILDFYFQPTTPSPSSPKLADLNFQYEKKLKRKEAHTKRN